jgi:hypothetical protein
VSGFPVRMAVLVDFSDGSQHEYEVRGPDTTEPPPGMALWPAAVVSTAMREQITREQACTQALADAVFRLGAIREWAEHPRTMEQSRALMGAEVGEGYLFAVNDVLAILDKP